MLNTMKKTLLRITRGAGAILMKYYGNLDNYDTKSREIDIVTVADKESEDYIIKEIIKKYPDHNILAEESGSGKKQESIFRWVIDPVDGTTNFAHTFPAFCVSIGIQEGDKTVLAAVYNPYYNEMFFAEKGKGAFLNDHSIHVSRTKNLNKSIVITGFAYDRREKADYYLNYYKAFMMRCHGIRRTGSAALDMCSVACGRAEAYYEENLKPWDTCAGWLIVEEAGGMVSDYSNRDFKIEKKQLLATNGLVHESMVEVFKG
jgi:myo-inositol-1(or 4)-monophosphatase